MKLLILAPFALAAATAFAQPPAHSNAPGARASHAQCNHCGTVQEVRQEKRKGEGGAVGMVGGAVVGGLLGNQIGGGSGRTLATVGGAVAGGYAGNEVQKHVNSRRVWVTRVRMKDGSQRTFEQEARPQWTPGATVRVTGRNTLVAY